MPINYGTDTVEEVEESEVEFEDEVSEQSTVETKPKLTLPNVATNYGEIADVWEGFYSKIAGIEGWGAKSFINACGMLKLHLRLAAQHLNDLKRHLDTVNGEARARTGAGDMSNQGRRRTFTSFFSKLSDSSLAAQCNLFQVKPVGEGRPKEVVVEELVKVAMEVE